MKLALGTVQFGLDYGISNKTGKTELRAVESILNKAREEKIDLLDTASSYGTSEEVLGGLGVSDFKIVTKFPTSSPNEKLGEWLYKTLERSLNNLRVDNIYCSMFHRTEFIDDKNLLELNDRMKRIKLNKKITKIGISVYSLHELNRLINLGFQFDLLQIPVNVFDQRFCNNKLIKNLKDRNVEVHSRSSFLQGLLLMKPNDRPAYFNKWSHYLEKWDDFLVQNRINALTGCIEYVKNQSFLDRVIVGVNTRENLEEILYAYKSDSYKLDFDFEAINEENLINPSKWTNL